MFKVGLLLVATAVTRRIGEFDDTVSMFEIDATEDEMADMMKQIEDTQEATETYVGDLYEGEVKGDRIRKRFIDDFEWLVRSKQYKALATKVQEIKNGADAAIKLE